METDIELLERWRKGDERAGRALFERHFEPIYRFFRNKIDDAADDLTQQTFLGCLKAKDRFRGDSSFRTYLFSIARNRLYSFLRERDRRQSTFVSGDQTVADLGSPTPTGFVAARGEQALLLRALRHLPLDMQIALELHYWEDLTIREIAEILETPGGTIKRRIQRGRQRLDVLIGELASDATLAASTQAGLATWAHGLREQIAKRHPDAKLRPPPGSREQS